MLGYDPPAFCELSYRCLGGGMRGQYIIGYVVNFHSYILDELFAEPLAQLYKLGPWLVSSWGNNEGCPCRIVSNPDIS